MLKNYRGLHAEKRRLEAGVDELQLTRQRLTKVPQRPCIECDILDKPSSLFVVVGLKLSKCLGWSSYTYCVHKLRR